MIEVVSATTRISKSDFWAKSALGQSLKRLSSDARLTPHIAFENSRGLPEIYNARINAQNSHEILIFIHDDVWIDDYFLADRVTEGLKQYDVIGVAGNRRRVPNQPSWAFAKRLDSGVWTWDDGVNLSGSVAHHTHPFGEVRCFGVAPVECELLDGVFLSAKKSVLADHQILFDPVFDFHFYDMDFCRVARKQGLRLSTWPICITHQSIGALNNQKWRDKFALYRKKWEAHTDGPP